MNAVRIPACVCKVNIIYEQEYEPKYVKEKVPVYVYENYTQSTSDENSANDYGQVTYS